LIFSPLLNLVRKYTFAFLCSCTIHCFAQHSIAAKVKQDSTGIAIPFVQVSVAELSQVTLSDEQGNFTISNVPNGNYVIMFKALGYQTKILSLGKNDTLGTVFLKPSYIEVPEVVIYGTNNSDPKRTANSITQLNQSDMRSSGAMNLSDAMSKLPGVSQLSTGSGISKPVIRGLFGNRVQTVLYGLRFDNQQWQDEHGLGLSDVGIDRIEIIKGAASLLYGSEAMGGVINIIEEKSAPVGKIQGDVSTRFFSNTLGMAGDVGVKGATKKMNWRLRAGTDSHADYTDGNNKRILNSRFGGYYAKAGVGFTRSKWISMNNYMFSQNNFGFLMDTVQLKDPPDSRASRGFDRPHHTVNLNVISSQNTFFLERSKLKVNVGFQNNNRQEQEGGNKISLNMILNSYIGNLIWTRSFNKLDWSLGSQGYYQTNNNIGSRTIIPDAMQLENSFYTYLKYTLKQLVFEGGARYDQRHIETYATGSINTDPLGVGKDVLPFTRNYSAFNGSGGLSWFNRNLNFKMNFSSGYRAGNLAELSSNGLHEGTVRYEIGDPNLKIEQNFCGDVYLAYNTSFIDLSVSSYYNMFKNYIYLAPSSLQYIGFDIFYYKQQNAIISGIESAINIHPENNRWFNWSTNYSYIDGSLAQGKPMPFIPAPKLNSDLKLTKKSSGNLKELFVRPGVTYVFEQTRIGEFETATPDYYLVNIATGCYFETKHNAFTVTLTGNNLLNKVYYDHLSRFKYFGIYNIGRNISLNLKVNFN
jgi:iron complex outermembrane receptor protein